MKTEILTTGLWFVPLFVAVVAGDGNYLVGTGIADVTGPAAEINMVSPVTVCTLVYKQCIILYLDKVYAAIS